MKETIELLKKHDEIKIIDIPLDIYLEIPHLAYIEVKKPDSKALLFTRPTRYGEIMGTPVLMNLFGSHSRVKLFIGDADEIGGRIQDLLHMKPPKGFFGTLDMLPKLFNLKNVIPKKLKNKGRCQEVITKESEVNLYDIPVLTTWEKDGGPFITMGQVYTQSLDGELTNLGMYRLQIYEKNRLGLHWQIHKDSSHFFDQYQKAGKKMPVSIALGGDPLYTWCGQAPLPYGVNELLMYGFIKGERATTVKSLTTPLYVPEDADFVIEGWVDPNEMVDEGPFGDHTGYYTPIEPYPAMTVSCITHKKDPVYPATVVGKPPLEDKYMGWATERIFMPLLKTTTPDLLDYAMPENGTFHNLIFAKIKTLYPGHAKQTMHAFWGVGQMSFVKHAVFVDENGPELEDYDALTRYILERFDPRRNLNTEGVLDALDHSSPEFAVGGKFGVDATGEKVENTVSLLDDSKLLEQAKALYPEIGCVKQYYMDTPNPIAVFAVTKKEKMIHCYTALRPLFEHLRIVFLVDAHKNDLDNTYMLVWRVVNNIDSQRDIFVDGKTTVIDATDKSAIDDYARVWPDDTDCTESVIENLKKKGVLDVDDAFLRHYHIVNSPATDF